MRALHAIRMCVAFALAASGCVDQSPTCSESAPALARALVADGVPLDRANSCPLSKRAVMPISVTRCDDGCPVPLVVYAPEAGGAYPVIVFQHGFIARNVDYSEILSAVASEGFVVIAPQMYEPTVDGMNGIPTAAEEAADAERLIDWLPGHLPTLIGYMPNIAELGLAGHSRGGKIAWLVAQSVPGQIRAIAGLDPVDGVEEVLGGGPEAITDKLDLKMPALVIGCGLSSQCAPPRENHTKFYAACAAPAWHIVIPDAGHADMQDEAAALAAGSVCETGNERIAVRQTVAGLLAVFFRGSLRGEHGAYALLSDTDGALVEVRVEHK